MVIKHNRSSAVHASLGAWQIVSFLPFPRKNGYRKIRYIRKMFKNNLDFHCSVNVFWYITMNFIWQQFAILRLLTEIPTIADSAHVSDVMYVLRFIQVTKPVISSRIIRFQVEKTNNIVALAVFMLILNISVDKTKFQYNGGCIWNRNLTITLSIDIFDSGQCKVIHTSSD